VKQVSGKEFVRILKSHGGVLKRVSGSHHILAKEGRQERIVIPIHGRQPLKVGLLKHQMKIANLSEADL
jgi:predicted RNA binding protein YcfA (HicA-like mRNA interferase family)